MPDKNTEKLHTITSIDSKSLDTSQPDKPKFDENVEKQQKRPKMLTIAEKRKIKKPRKSVAQNRLELKRRAKIIAQEMINGSSARQACITAGYSNKTNPFV